MSLFFPRNRVLKVVGFVVLALGLLACKSKPSKTIEVGAHVQAVERVWSSDHEAIPVWVGADARFAAFWVFDRDTNSDGEARARFGDHGESLGDEPRLVLVDGQSHDVVPAENVIAIDPVGHFLVLEKDGLAVLFNGRTGSEEVLPNVDLERDHNACERHRSVSFDATGGRIGWVSKDNAFVTRAVRGGEPRVFKSERRIWRGEPLADANWAVLETVDGAFPRMKTSCHASWSRGLARSSGRYGWDRDYQTTLVRHNGLHIELSRRLLPLSRDVLLDVDKLQMESTDGTPVGPVKHAFLGSDVVVIQRGDRQVLLNVDTRAEIELPKVQLHGPIQVLHHGREWVHGRQPTGEAVRVHLLTGQVDVGPPIVGPLTAPHQSGWWSFKSGVDALTLWDLQGGQMTTIKVEGLHQVASLVFSRREEGKEQWYAIDPTTGNYARLRFRPQWTGETGCSMPNAISGLVSGLKATCPHGQPEKSASTQ